MSAKTPIEGDRAPIFGFEDSRRLTGPNLYFAGPGATLAALGSPAGDAAAVDRWAADVRQLAAQLGWPDPQPLAHRHAQGLLLNLTAPADQLFTATEVNEWAWEQRLREHGELPPFDAAMPADRGAARALLFARAAAERAGFEPGPPRPRVPTLLVTGSNGKTTTVRLLAAMARAAGLASGLCSTEGIEIAGEHVAQGDWSGPEGAKRVLHDPRSEAAILETARGGILRRGLAVREADAAIVTNLSADHFGEYGIDSLDDLARAKLVVARAVQHGGTLVLNAGDEALMRAAEALPHARAARRALFAADGLHPRLRALRECGGSSCGVADGHLTLHLSGMAHDLCAVEALPLTLGGAARHNIENLAAAALAAAVVGWPVEAIRHVVQTFGRDPLDNPGRLERWHWRGATVLIDYAHNPDGLAQLLALARSLQPRRLLLLLGQAGNRDAAALAALARVVANDAPDLVVLKELPQMLRGRAPGEVSAILRGELIATGFAAGRLQMRPDEAQGARALLDAAEPGDVIVLPLHEAAPRAAVRALLQGAG